MSDADDLPKSSKMSSTSRRLRRFPFSSRSKRNQQTQPPESTFDPDNILPQDGHEPYPKRPVDDEPYPRRPVNETEEEEEKLAQRQQQQPFGAPRAGAGGQQMSTGDRSASPPSVFDEAAPDDRETEPTTRGSNDNPGDYDLKAPPPTHNHENIETLSGRFFSADHLDLILRDQSHAARFGKFLNQYKPQSEATLGQYIESRKAITAVEYANAIAAQQTGHGEHAADLSESFDVRSKQIAEELVDEALPSYLTYRLVGLVTETLVKEITGNSTPFMREMIPSLAEVYCITDPSLPDNPIVYASEEFYNTTQYGKNYVIGRNCRFLQGPKTANSTVRRLIEALTAGEEVIETILNYRRDGSPFMNLLMIAPMYDNKGDVRYYLGAQIDVSQLVEGGKGMESFSQLLSNDRQPGRRRGGKEPMDLLGELGQLLNEPEANFVSNRIKRPNSSGTSTPQQQNQSSQRRPQGRRIFSVDDASSAKGHGSLRALWPDPALGSSGRLPGVYRNYLLVRPAPSLRITFTSPALRIPGLLQTKLLDRIGGPQEVREGIQSAFEDGTALTAKIQWLTHNGNSNEGKTRWIHCTPMLGSDERVGVWMVVMVEEEEVTGTLNGGSRRDGGSLRSANANGLPQTMAQSGMGLSAGGGSQHSGSARGGERNRDREADDDGGANKMYADYLKQKRPGTTESVREQRGVDAQFADF